MPRHSTYKKKVWRQPAYLEEGCGRTCSEINARYSTPVQLWGIGQTVLPHDHTSDEWRSCLPDFENYHIFFQRQYENTFICNMLCQPCGQHDKGSNYFYTFNQMVTSKIIHKPHDEFRLKTEVLSPHNCNTRAINAIPCKSNGCDTTKM